MHESTESTGKKAIAFDPSAATYSAEEIRTIWADLSEVDVNDIGATLRTGKEPDLGNNVTIMEGEGGGELDLTLVEKVGDADTVTMVDTGSTSGESSTGTSSRGRSTGSGSWPGSGSTTMIIRNGMSQVLLRSVSLTETIASGGEEGGGEGGKVAATGDLDLRRVLGRGGMGVVYVARQNSLSREVAVKMLLPGGKQTGAAREKLVSEALVTGELDHPNIIPIYELGQSETGQLFYSMKIVRGKPWSKEIKNYSERKNIEILLRIADAVAFSHDKSIIHRDIKPENVMLGDYGEILLMDWGLAVSVSADSKAEPITPENAKAGTPAYMAPEMAVGDVAKLSPASDIYLLGAVLFEILAGSRPHTGPNVYVCLHAAAENFIVPTDRDDELMQVALKAMAAEPGDRYPTAKAFQAAVTDVLSHSESLVLTRNAEESLARAREEKHYEGFAQAVFAYREAAKLWPENRAALSGEVEARRSYAACAFENGDYDLARVTLDNLDGAEASALRARIDKARDEREARRKRLRLVTRVAVGLVAAVVLILIGATVIIANRMEAERQARERATEQEQIAIQALQDTQSAQERERQAAVEREEALLREKEAQDEALALAQEREQVLAREKNAQDAALAAARESQAALAREKEAQDAALAAAQEREAALAREKEAQDAALRIAQEREAALAREKEAQDAALAAAQEREAALAREKEAQDAALRIAQEREAALAGEKEAQDAALAAAQEREAALAREKEAQDEALAAAQEREAALAREKEAQDEALRIAQEREAALAREKEAQDAALTAAQEREAALAREKEAQDAALAAAQEREAALAREKEAQDEALRIAQEREAALAREKEAQDAALAAAQEREAALAREKEAQDAALRIAQEREAALAREKEAQDAALAAAQEREVALIREREAQAAHLEAMAREEEERRQREQAEQARRQVTEELTRRGFLEDDAWWTFAPAEAAERQAKAAAAHGLEAGTRIALGGTAGIDLALIPPGEFVMGSSPRDPLHQPDEYLHRVELTRPYYLGVTEATRGQWRAVVGVENAADLMPEFSSILTDESEENYRKRQLSIWGWRVRELTPEEADLPATGVSFREIRDLFLARLEGMVQSGLRPRLPTEAEWEYACRAGSSAQFANGDWDDAGYQSMGWMRENSEMTLHPVSGFAPNAWGLRDMHGNAGEVVQDAYQADFYITGPEVDPVNDASGLRVLRGGTYIHSHQGCRSASRSNMHPENRFEQAGFRLAFSARDG